VGGNWDFPHVAHIQMDSQKLTLLSDIFQKFLKDRTEDAD